MKRALPILAVLALAACGDPDAARRDALAAAAEQSGRIDCATEGAALFERVCAVERSAGPEGLVLTVRAPSGSFRRLLVTNDGRGVVAADGADQANVTMLGNDQIEVAIAEDRYRLPATMKQ